MSDSSVGSFDPSLPVPDSAPAVEPLLGHADWPARPMSWPQFAMLLAIVVFSIALRWRIASIPLERDEGEYAYIAQRWLAGDMPYRDAFDQKPPGIFLAYAALFAIGARSAESIHWLGHMSLVGTLVFVYLIGRRLWSHVVGCLAALCTVVLVMDGSVKGNASNTEVFAILPLAAGMFFSLRAAEEGRLLDSLLAGVAGGLAMCFKQVSLPIVAFQCIWLAVARVRYVRPATNSAGGARPTVDNSLVALLAIFAAGIAAVWLPTCGYFVAKGAWGQFYDCVIGHNLAYSARIPLRAYGDNLQYAVSRIWTSQWLTIVVAGLGVFVGFRRRSPATGVCLWWWLATMAGVSVGGYFREHYFILLMPPTALIAASGAQFAAQLLEPKRVQWQGVIATFTVFAALSWPLTVNRGYYLARDPNLEARWLYHANPFVESAALGRVLREHSMPDDRIFIHGSEPQILFYAERASASRYIYVYPLYSSDREAAARQKSVLDELRRDPPKFVVFVLVPQSLGMHPNAPNTLEKTLVEFTNERYGPFADVVLAVDGRFRVVYSDSPDRDRRLADYENVTMFVRKRRD